MPTLRDAAGQEVLVGVGVFWALTWLAANTAKKENKKIK
jgi:hypothetical protein